MLDRPLIWAGLWALIAVLLAVAAVPALVDSPPNAPPRLLYTGLGGMFAACGLLAWRRRPDNHSGRWMLAAGLGFFVAPVLLDFDSPALEAISDKTNGLWGIAMIALLVSFANGGRLERTADRVLVGALAAANLALIAGADALAVLLGAFACLGAAVLIGVRYRRASPPLRRAMLPSVAGIAALLFAAASLPPAVPEAVAWIAVLLLLLVPVAFLVSLAAAEFALERERQQRLIVTGDAQRRQLERDLHDGAQQRLVAVSMQLRLIQADLAADPVAAAARVETASDQLAKSLDELRELARGLHPAVLDHGLAAALTTIAVRSAVPTAVTCEELTLPRRVELALYFVACEALANVGGHAGATAASVRVTAGDRDVAIEIADDGAGVSQPSGLSDLEDRVTALGGRLLVTSPQGAGTLVRAELPCAS